MDRKSYLSLIAGSGLSAALFSSVFALALLTKALTQGELRVLYLFGFVAAAWASGLVTRYTLRALADEPPAKEHPDPRPSSSVKGHVMLLARSAKGRLSASEVAAATKLSVAESHQVLKGLIKEGVADIWITDSGGVVYVFPELLEDFKEGARSPLTGHPLEEV